MLDLLYWFASIFHQRSVVDRPKNQSWHCEGYTMEKPRYKMIPYDDDDTACERCALYDNQKACIAKINCDKRYRSDETSVIFINVGIK